MRTDAGPDDVVILSDLDKTNYVKTDENVQKYNLKQYVTWIPSIYYVHLVNFESKVAKNVDESGKLVEATFDYVYDFEGDKLVQKRKWWIILYIQI